MRDKQRRVRVRRPVEKHNSGRRRVRSRLRHPPTSHCEPMPGNGPLNNHGQRPAKIPTRRLGGISSLGNRADGGKWTTSRYRTRDNRLLAKHSQTAAGGPLETGARVKPSPPKNSHRSRPVTSHKISPWRLRTGRPPPRRKDYDEARFVDWTSSRRQPGRPAVACASIPPASADVDVDWATSRSIALLLQYPARSMLRQGLNLRPLRPWLLVQRPFRWSAFRRPARHRRLSLPWVARRQPGALLIINDGAR